MHTGLYIHLPFCKQKCNYCDFASFAGMETQIDAYLQALAAEASQHAATAYHTVYVGGGTPSLLSLTQLEKLCQLIHTSRVSLPACKEATFEANPESLIPAKIALLHQAGFNRFSVGLQSFHEDELKQLGRVHTADDFRRAFEALRAQGIKNINVDLIAGLPGQTLERFLSSLERVLALKPEHLSVYGLQIEEGTPFFERGIVCDQLLMRRMLEETRARLMTAGYHHYEISNFALPGYESQHNTHYWQYGEYVGLGSAAASFQNGVRSQNTPSVLAYIEHMKDHTSPVVFREALSGKAKEGEKLLVGLRQLDGVELSATQQRLFGKEIAKHVQNGLLQRVGKKVKLSEEGLFLANEVFCSFVAPFEEV